MIINDSLNIVADQSSHWGVSAANYILNLIAGALICVVISAFFAPSFERWVKTMVLRKIWNLTWRSKSNLTGKWTHKWHVQSENFKGINVIESVEIRQFRNQIFAQYEVSDLQENIYKYQVLGNIENKHVITGTWKDVNIEHGYFGCYQLHIDINQKKLTGYWTGISNDDRIKSGKWEWFKE